MLARRIVAVAPDKAFGKRLSVALMAAGGTVDWHATADELGKGELGAALLVVHMADATDLASVTALVGRLGGDSKAIVILPAVSLPAVVELMQGSEKVAGLLVAEDLDLRSLSAMATRVMAGDLFGLDKLVRWGTQIHNHLVGDYQEKSLCISQTSEFAEAIGVRRKYREAIEQCMDEMLMNALYDAPVDEQGKQIFSEIPTKTRISLRVEQKVVVQYACDGTRFYLSVRDAFGTLERATVLRYLHKCLYSEQQIDRKAGGAGLGLYLMVNASSEVYFNVLPGVATEAVCVFDLETPKLQLDCIGFFYERIDAAGRLAGGPSRRLPAGVGFPVERRAPRGPAPVPPAAPAIGKPVIALLVAMIAVVGGLIAAVAIPRMRGGGGSAAKKTTVEVHTDPPGATIELDGKSAGVATGGKFTITDVEVGHTYPIVARLEGYEVKTAVIQPVEGGSEISMHLVAQAPTVRLETMPSGAAVAIDGKDTGGVTPLVVTTLVPGATVKLAFKKAGFHDAEVALDVPGPGKETRLVQPLAVADDVARVKIISDPPGAQITQNGQLVAGVVTPADLLVEAGKPVRFTLSMAKKVSVTLEPFTPLPGADGIVKSVTFVDGVTLAVTVAGVDNAKLTVGGQPQCGHAAPVECMVAPGKYTIALEAAGGVRAVHRGVVVGGTTAADKFELGTVTAGAGKKLQGPAGTPVGKLTLEAGARKVTVIDEDGTTTHVATVTVSVGASVVAN